MKESVIGIISGVGAGFVIIALLAAVLFWSEADTNLQAGNTQSSGDIESLSDTENLSDIESGKEESSVPVGTDNETSTELGSWFVTEEVTEAGTEKEEEEPAEDTESGDANTPPVTGTTEPPAPVEVKYYVRVNRQMNVITVYEKDAAGEYTVPVKAMVCSVGRGERTPVGLFTISSRYVWHELYGPCYGQYCTRITGHILFHSVPYYTPNPNDLKYKLYNNLGEKASAGCIRLSVADAKWIYENCPAGTKVEIFDSPEMGPLGKPVALKIPLDHLYRGWDPMDPRSENPWHQLGLTMTGIEDISIEVGENPNYLAKVKAFDIDGITPAKLEVSGTVDIQTPGEYIITYTATGITGKTATASAVVRVRPHEHKAVDGGKEEVHSVCEKCQEVLAGKEGHIFDSGKIILEATEKEEGKLRYRCSCGYYYDTVIEKLPHTHVYDEGVVTREPTAFETGIKKFSCSCGHSYEEVLEMLPPSETETPSGTESGSEPTETESESEGVETETEPEEQN